MNHAYVNTRPADSASDTLPWDMQWPDIRPLWRTTVWLMSAFLLFSGYLFVQVNVLQLHKELDHIERMQRLAVGSSGNLLLEEDARGRTHAMKQVADQLALGPAVVVKVQHTP